MAKVECCHNCVYARWDPGLWLRTLNSVFPAGPVCANQPDFPGRMKECPFGRVCNNFRARPPTPKGESVKTISLGDGFYAYVEAADFDWLNQWTWSMCNGYAARRSNENWIYMHREIMKPPRGMDVDHKNHNKLDNTRESLRVCTREENIRNRRKPRNTSSQFWGVSYIKKSAKYMAFVSWKRNVVSCGCFLDELEAARAHDAKAVELLGESAQLNFPEEWPEERRAQTAAAGRKTKARARKTAAKKAPRKTPAAQRTTKPKRATGHGSRATKKTHAETQGRRGGKGQTRAKPAKPGATRDERRATKTKRATK